MSYDDTSKFELQNAKSKRYKTSALGGTNGRETAGDRRVIVRFTGFRCRPLDPDNFAGSVKDCLDGLRYAHLLEGDEPWKIILQTDQVKVRHKNEEKTVIEIEYA